MLIIPCPQCRKPAEVCDQFSLQSTDGPVEMATVRCSRPDSAHEFRMALDRLPATILAAIVEQQHCASDPAVLIIPCPECQTPAEVSLNERQLRIDRWRRPAPLPDPRFRRQQPVVAVICCSRPGSGHDLEMQLDHLPAESLAAILQQQRQAREQPGEEPEPGKGPRPSPQLQADALSLDGPRLSASKPPSQSAAARAAMRQQQTGGESGFPGRRNGPADTG